VARGRKRRFLRKKHEGDVIVTRRTFKKRYILFLLLVVVVAYFVAGPRKTTVARVSDRMHAGDPGGSYILTGVVLAVKDNESTILDVPGLPAQRVFPLKDATGTVFVIDGRDRSNLESLREPKMGERVRVVGRIKNLYESQSEGKEGKALYRFVARKIEFLE